jgi:hypothetical protein
VNIVCSPCLAVSLVIPLSPWRKQNSNVDSLAKTRFKCWSIGELGCIYRGQEFHLSLLRHIHLDMKFDISSAFNWIINLGESVIGRRVYFPTMKLQAPHNPNALAISGGGRHLACGGELLSAN